MNHHTPEPLKKNTKKERTEIEKNSIKLKKEFQGNVKEMKASERGRIRRKGYNIAIPLPDAVARRLSEAPVLQAEALTGFMEEQKAMVVGMTGELSEHADWLSPGASAGQAPT